jgi:hypothetical protein
MKMSISLTILAAFTVSCGSAETSTKAPASDEKTIETPPLPTQPDKSTSMSFASAQKLPKCSESNEGSLAYLLVEKEFRTCTAGSWNTVDIAGKDGTNGKEGTDCTVSDSGLVTCGSATHQIPNFKPQFRGVAITAEASGANCIFGGSKVTQFNDTNGNGQKDSGEDDVGSAKYICKDYGRIIQTYRCSGQIETTGIYYEYQAQITNAGDVLVQAVIQDAYQGISSSVNYGSGQAGAKFGFVSVSFDLRGANGGGYWEVSLNRSTLVPVITYNDVEFNPAVDTFTIPASNCSVVNLTDSN